ncbi:hypothetical protein QVD17_40304 [Tagetes erecta]|uniref:Uncharacterized protein n=1 Tax=Tagetes erecta TaxID=13708 RepID=A0AAD8JPT0_TARER|nr:hypothetical protein QVD17_40304 [Tagetes erecta]
MFPVVSTVRGRHENMMKPPLLACSIHQVSRRVETRMLFSVEGKNENFRENLERIIGADDSAFSGIDLTTLYRKKYGRYYDVQLVRKLTPTVGVGLYAEIFSSDRRRIFDYLPRLDDLANTLICWGDVSHIRNSLEKLKERPRIEKAVSIFIDMDERGGRTNDVPTT